MQLPNLATLFGFFSKLKPAAATSQTVTGMLATGRLTWKWLLAAFMITSAICSVIGVFLPFVSVRSFGLGGGSVCTLIVWYVFYLALQTKSQ